VNLKIKYFNPAEINLLKEISLYKAMETLDSTRVEDFAPLGRIRFLLGDYKKAVELLERYHDRFPLDLSGSLWLGWGYYMLNAPQKGDRIWDWVKRSGGMAVKRKLALVFSTVKEKQGEAVRLLEETRDKGIVENQRFDAAYYRKHKDYYHTLGRVYLNREEFKKAADTLMLTFERSRRDRPGTYDRDYLLCLGYALARTGRFKESIDFAFKGAAALTPAAYQVFHAVNHGLYMLRYE
jgi:tetratricopeptide (TPR) repeat protein